MFRRLRLVGRGPTALPLNKPSARFKPARIAPGAVDVKALLSTALAHRPTWTNSLPVADPKGRAANTSAIYPQPRT